MANLASVYGTPVLPNQCVVVIIGCQGIIAAKELSPRAQPEDKVSLYCHNSLLTNKI